jgi:hypothetical protein
MNFSQHFTTHCRNEANEECVNKGLVLVQMITMDDPEQCIIEALINED